MITQENNLERTGADKDTGTTGLDFVFEKGGKVPTIDREAIAKALTAYIWEYYSNTDELIAPLSKIRRMQQPAEVHNFPVDEHSKTVGILTASLLGEKPIFPSKAEEFSFFSAPSESIPFDTLRDSQKPEHRLWIETYDLCKRLADQLNITGNEKSFLILYGYLHDMGKYLPKALFDTEDHDLAGIDLLKTMSKKYGGSVSDSTIEELENIHKGYNSLVSNFMKKEFNEADLELTFKNRFIQTVLIAHTADELGRGWNFTDNSESAVNLRMAKLQTIKRLVEYNVKLTSEKQHEKH